MVNYDIASDELEFMKKKTGHFLFHLFHPKEIFLTYVFYLNI